MDGARPTVVVTDEGPGIPAEDRQKVFRRFFRREQSRTTPGSGLGLALVSAIADLHGAEISLRDNNPGLRAVVKFPACHAKSLIVNVRFFRDFSHTSERRREGWASVI